ncbi:hypothetical protein MRX96_007497 [Rhipicephalus microplus]
MAVMCSGGRRAVGGQLRSRTLGLVLVVLALSRATSANIDKGGELRCQDGWSQDGVYCYKFFSNQHSWRRAEEGLPQVLACLVIEDAAVPCKEMKRPCAVLRRISVEPRTPLNRSQSFDSLSGSKDHTRSYR